MNFTLQPKLDTVCQSLLNFIKIYPVILEPSAAVTIIVIYILEKKQQPLEGEVDQGKVSKINLLSPVAAKTQLNTSSMNNMSLSNNVSFINRNNSEAKKCCALQVYKTINLLPLLRFKGKERFFLKISIISH